MNIALKHHKVMFFVETLAWLGISQEDLVDELNKRSIEGVALVASDYLSDEYDFQETRGEALPALQDSAAYAASIEDEDIIRPYVSTSSTSYLRRLNALRNGFVKLQSQLGGINPDLLLFVQGYEPTSALLRAICREERLKGIAIENTSLNNKMIWDDRSLTTPIYNRAKEQYQRHKRSILESDLRNFSENFKTRLKNSKSNEHRSNNNRTLTSGGRPIVLYLAQVYTDASVIFGLQNYPTPLNLIKLILHWCNMNQHLLIIKMHPKEVKGVAPVTGLAYNSITTRLMNEDREIQSLIERNEAIIDSNNDFDTYTLIELAEVVVTINSQSGLEAAILGKSVVTCGEAFYGDSGFTFDGKNPMKLSDALLERVTNSQSTEAMKFGKIFYDVYCREKSAASLANLLDEKLRGDL